MITGDNKLTAEAICRTIGVFEPEGSLEGRSLTGREFVELPLEERKAILQVQPPHRAGRFVQSAEAELSPPEVYKWLGMLRMQCPPPMRKD